MNKLIYIMLIWLLPMISYSQVSAVDKIGQTQVSVFDKIDRINQLGDGVIHLVSSRSASLLSYKFKNFSKQDLRKYRGIMSLLEENSIMSNHFECHESEADTISYRMMLKSENVVGSDNEVLKSEFFDSGANGYLEASTPPGMVSETCYYSPVKDLQKMFADEISGKNIKGVERLFDEQSDHSDYLPEIKSAPSDTVSTKGQLYIFPNEGRAFCEKFERLLLDHRKGLLDVYSLSLRKGIGKSLGRNYKILYTQMCRMYDTEIFLAIVYKGKLRLFRGQSYGPFYYIPAWWFMTPEEMKENNID